MTHSQGVSLLKNASGTIELQVKKSSVTFGIFSEYYFSSCCSELFSVSSLILLVYELCS